MTTEIQNVLYECPTAALVVALLVAMSVANELGFRYGRRDHDSESELSRSVSNSLKASVFGLVALLLGFSFSATTSRHDLRQRLVLEQANAIGTCYLRAGLLDDASCTRIRSILRNYVDVRIEQFSKTQTKSGLARTQKEIDVCLTELWTEVEKANQGNSDALLRSLIVPAANDVIDLRSTRAWATHNHLPTAVLTLLLTSVIFSSLLLGHSSGQANRRHVVLWLVTNVVFSLVLYVVLDYDRPRRGLIQVDHSPLLELKASIGEPNSL